MRATLTYPLFVLIACGSEGAPPEPSATEDPGPETQETQGAQAGEGTNALEVETTYAIHEWGFIAHHYADEESEMLTSGTAPAPWRRPALVDPHSYGRGGGKPVIYVHLQGEGTIARFTASLSTAGRFLEEWPHSEGSTPTRLTWDVEARQGSCSAVDNYPVADDAHCAGIVDGYCEAAELGHYETEDGACLTIDGKEWNHLFYRAQMVGDVPLRVSKDGDDFTVRNSATLPGRLIRIHRADEASDTRVSLLDAPAAGESLVLPATPDQPAAAGIDALRSELSALGMSDDEVGAFMTAWQAELFGDSPGRSQIEMVGSPPRDLRPKADALIYFLPMATLDAMVPLTLTPPPAIVRRAILVRIDLGDAYVPSQGTIGLGNLAAIGHSSSAAGTGYGGTRPSRVGQPLRVRQGTVVVDGALAREIVRRVMRRHLNEVRACGERHLVGVGTEGGLLLKFVIGATGAVESSEVEGNPAELSTCIANAVRRWTFPTHDSGATRVTAPLHFELR